MKLKENSFWDRYLRATVGIILAILALGLAFATVLGVIQ